MRRHRTTARGALLLLLLALGTSAASASPRPQPGSTIAPAPTPAPIVFPVIGQTRYIRDFGDPRVNGSHQGTDIMSPRRSAVVAAEAGRVEWWTTSARAGCMLYLYGASGTTYLYIHLNNDATQANDNRGGCVRGIAYTVADGARVATGAQIAWSGDSGDADGNPHTQFEVHPRDGAAVDPFPYLQAAEHLLFPGGVGARVTVGLRGRLVAAGGGSVELVASSVRWWPGGRWLAIDPRPVALAVPEGADVDASLIGAIRAPDRRSPSSRGDIELQVVTVPGATSAEMLRAAPRTLVAARVRVRPGRLSPVPTPREPAGSRRSRPSGRRG